MKIQDWIFIGLVAVLGQIVLGIMFICLFIMSWQFIFAIMAWMFLFAAIYETLYIKSKIPTPEEKSP